MKIILTALLALSVLAGVAGTRERRRWDRPVRAGSLEVLTPHPHAAVRGPEQGGQPRARISQYSGR